MQKYKDKEQQVYIVHRYDGLIAFVFLNIQMCTNCTQKKNTGVYMYEDVKLGVACKQERDTGRQAR